MRVVEVEGQKKQNGSHPVRAGWLPLPRSLSPMLPGRSPRALSQQDERRQATADDGHEADRQRDAHERRHVETQGIDSGKLSDSLYQCSHLGPPFNDELKLS